MKILANKILSEKAAALLQQKGFEILDTKVAPEQLAAYINKNDIEVLLVRQGTTLDKNFINQCEGLKLIGVAGEDLTGVAQEYAQHKGIHVVHTPWATATALAELVMAHLLGGSRFLHETNRNMPLEGDAHFNELHHSYSAGQELQGKTLGILGWDPTAQEVAKKALGLGMKVLYHAPDQPNVALELDFFDGQTLSFQLQHSDWNEFLAGADFLTLHRSDEKKPVIGEEELGMVKSGLGLVNVSEAGLVDEVALVHALENGKVSFAGLDIFESGTQPELPILMNQRMSLSPRIGASTLEAEARMGMDLAQQLIDLLG